MRFEWDDKKRRDNLTKHGIDFFDVAEIFESEVVTDVDERFDYGETRYYTFGVLRGVIVVVLHTESDELVRVISIRKAEKYEEEIYFKEIRD